MGIKESKPKLSPGDQVEHLKSKGVGFELFSEEDARIYLEDNNNYRDYYYKNGLIKSSFDFIEKVIDFWF